MNKSCISGARRVGHQLHLSKRIFRDASRCRTSGKTGPEATAFEHIGRSLPWRHGQATKKLHSCFTHSFHSCRGVGRTELPRRALPCGIRPFLQMLIKILARSNDEPITECSGEDVVADSTRYVTQISRSTRILNPLQFTARERCPICFG